MFFGVLFGAAFMAMGAYTVILQMRRRNGSSDEVPVSD
jgi:hypothetical protein